MIINYQIIIPAMLAVINEAIVPPTRAFNPNWERVVRCLGAIALIPPICIPIEAKLAKPQSAYVVIIIDFSLVNRNESFNPDIEA